MYGDVSDTVARAIHNAASSNNGVVVANAGLCVKCIGLNCRRACAAKECNM